jgi:hypothetical protein
MSLPLEGIRVVDFSRVLAGPHCAKTLLDLGAEVIKLEPPSGDLSRKAFPSRGEISSYYSQQNAGKRNLSIDLNVPGARDVALRLCDTADVIVENFRPGALAAFGLGFESVSARAGSAQQERRLRRSRCSWLRVYRDPVKVSGQRTRHRDSPPDSAHHRTSPWPSASL